LTPRIDSCITQLKAQGPSRTCNESKEEEEKDPPRLLTETPSTASEPRGNNLKGFTDLCRENGSGQPHEATQASRLPVQTSRFVWQWGTCTYLLNCHTNRLVCTCNLFAWVASRGRPESGRECRVFPEFARPRLLREDLPRRVQGYLAHKKPHPPLRTP